jgi:hypothetical protein
VTTFTRLPRTQLLVLIALIILVAELFANGIIGDTGESDVGGWVGLSLFGIALTAVLVLVVVPRIGGPDKHWWILGFGVGAVLTCVIFWSAIPFALGAGALAAAKPGDDRAEGEGQAPSTAGVLLALLSIVAAFILCLVG